MANAIQSVSASSVMPSDQLRQSVDSVEIWFILLICSVVLSRTDQNATRWTPADNCAHRTEISSMSSSKTCSLLTSVTIRLNSWSHSYSFLAVVVSLLWVVRSVMFVPSLWKLVEASTGLLVVMIAFKVQRDWVHLVERFWSRSSDHLGERCWLE